MGRDARVRLKIAQRFVVFGDALSEVQETTQTTFNIRNVMAVEKDFLDTSFGTFHHQMHHRYFECNYGSLELPWDKWFGSFHDGTVESDTKIRERRKKFTNGTK